MTELLHVQDLSRRFGGLRAVNELSFSLRQGEIAGLLGPNGSGKTTALNVISGLLPPSGGEVLLDGQRISGLSPARVAHRGVARTFQLVRPLQSLSVLDNVVAAIAFRREPGWGQPARTEAARLLERVGLAGRAGQPAASLTYIDLKRVELARALAARPQLLLLDEWLAGLNPTELRTGIALIASLRDSSITILMVEHVMDAIRALCDRCIVMNAGEKLADGPTAEVLQAPEVIRAYLGTGDA